MSRKYDYFTKEELENYKKILYVYLDTKRVKIIEFIKGKVRTILNKEREVRHTKAGGFSQSKFQSHVKWMKSVTLSWQTNQFEKNGLFHPPYDMIKLDCKDEEQRENALTLLSKLGKVIIL